MGRPGGGVTIEAGQGRRGGGFTGEAWKLFLFADAWNLDHVKHKTN